MDSHQYEIRAIETVGGDGRHVWTAEHPELLGCVATGETPEQAIENLGTSREAWLSVARDIGLEIPRPRYEDVVVSLTYAGERTTDRDANWLDQPATTYVGWEAV